jgi:Ricin-type beta-trefoil lectin domain-like
MKALRRISLVLAAVVTSGAIILVPQAAHADPDGTFSLVNVGSGKCLEIAPEDGHFFLDGLRIWQFTCDPTRPQQRWFLVSAGNGPIAGGGNPPRFFIVNNYTNRCLDVTDGSSANRTPLQQWTCNGGTSMMWGFSGAYIINARTSPLACVDIAGGSSLDFAYAQQYRCTAANSAQQFFSQ